MPKQKSKSHAVTLPGWLLKELPPILKPAKFDWNEAENSYVLRHPDGSVEKLDPDILEAQRLANADFKLTKRAIAKALEQYPGSKNHLGFLSIKNPGGGYYTMVGSMTDARRMDILLGDYACSQEAYQIWLKEPNSFINAWRILDRHPAFWVRDFKKLYYEPIRRSDLWDWRASGLCQELYIEPYTSKNGKVQITIEAGSHVESAQNWINHQEIQIDGYYEDHYHDVRLDTVAKSFEKAIIKLARKVNKIFNNEGNERLMKSTQESAGSVLHIPYKGYWTIKERSKAETES